MEDHGWSLYSTEAQLWELLARNGLMTTRNIILTKFNSDGQTFANSFIDKKFRYSSESTGLGISSLLFFIAVKELLRKLENVPDVCLSVVFRLISRR